MTASPITGRLVDRLLSRLVSSLPAGASRRIVGNAGLLMAERAVRLVIALGVTLLVARYLGVSDFGVLSYAISVAMIAEVVGGLGLSEILIRELVQRPEDERRLLGSALALSVLAGAGAWLAAVALVWVVDGDSRGVLLVAVVAAGVPFRGLSILDRAFQARMQAQYSVIARLLGLTSSAVVKVALLVLQAPLLAFAVAQALEAVVAGIGFGVLYARTHLPLSSLRASTQEIGALLRESWPLAFAAVAAVVYLRIDQVMLRHMTTDAEVGAYAAAARLSEVWYFVPVAFGTALYPALIATRDRPEEHDRHLLRALELAGWGAVVLAVLVSVFAELGVRLLYGDAFAAAADILRVHIWAGPFIFLSTFGGRSLIARGLQRFEAARHLLGAPINIALNLVLIPQYGAMGAALATLASYMLTSYVLMLAYPPTRHVGVLMTRAWLWPLRALRSRSGV